MLILKSRTFIILLILIIIQVLLYSKPVTPSSHTYEEIYIEARTNPWQWEFFYENGTSTLNYLEIYADVPYTLTATSLSSNHKLHITTGLQDITINAALGINTSVDVTFSLNEAITATCNQVCGGGHNTMSANMAVISGGLIIITVGSTTTETVGGSGATNITQTATISSLFNQTIETTNTETTTKIDQTTIVITKTTPFLYLNSFIIFVLVIKFLHNGLLKDLSSHDRRKLA